MANEAGFSAQLRKDLSTVYGSEIFVQLIPNMIRTGKKPFDFWFLIRDRFTAIECKFVRKGEYRFHYKSEIRPHQPECLQKINDCGGGGCFCVAFHSKNTAFFFSPLNLDYLIEYAKSDSSITFDELLQCSKDHPNRIGMIERKKVDGYTRWEVEKLVCSE